MKKYIITGAVAGFIVGVFAVFGYQIDLLGFVFWIACLIGIIFHILLDVPVEKVLVYTMMLSPVSHAAFGAIAGWIVYHVITFVKKEK